MFSFIRKGAVHIDSSKKIIKAKEFSECMNFEEILEQSKNDINEKIKEMEKEHENVLEIAKKKGEEEGLQKFNDQIFKLDNELKNVYHELNKMVLSLAIKAAKKIVSKELELHPDIIVSIIQKTLSPVLQSNFVKIFVNKKDKEILDKEKQKIKETLDQVKILSIEERNDIESGGCVIQTEGGLINAKLENQWAALEKAFETYLKKQQDQ